MNAIVSVIFAGTLIAAAIVYFSTRALTENETVRRWVLRVLVAGTLCVLLLAGGVWMHLGGMQGTSAQRIQTLQAQGLPTNGRELNDYYVIPPGGIDDTVAWEAIQKRLMEIDLPRERLERLPVVGLSPLECLQPGGDWSQQADVADLLEEHSAAVSELRTVALRGGYTRFDVDFAPRPLQAKLSHLPRIRNAARWLSLSAVWHAWQSDGPQLGDDLTALLSLSRANQNDPVLISALVNGAVFSQWFDSTRRASRLCPLAERDCVKMQQWLLEIDFEEQMLRALRGERAMGLTELEVIRSPLTVESRRAYLDYFEYHERLLQNPDDPALLELQDVLLLGQNRIFGRQRFFALRLLAPALQQSMESMREMEARRRVGLLALAARRFQLHEGQLPHSVTQLAAWLPSDTGDDLLTDPCTEQPLVFSATDASLLIYSSGRDGKDDGGQIDRKSDGDDLQPPTDIGIRLPALVP
ncbi:MAG: hypothetical protein NXI04_03930 [Planctomycetaceae bacterium]|nr:hypothetical protein [Planctomycetaceae bacterium]